MVVANFSKLSPLQQRLLDGLDLIPDWMPLCLIGSKKAPLGDDWTNRPYRADEVRQAIVNGADIQAKGKTYRAAPKGYGVITGQPVTIMGETLYLMALDQDGHSAKQLIQKLSLGEGLPDTYAFTSDRPGRCQFLFTVSPEYASHIRTVKLKTGVQGDDGKPEQLEFRWSNLQSVLPPSVHPETGCYRWRRSPQEVAIAPAPKWVIEQMLAEPEPTTPSPERRLTSISASSPSEREWSSEDWALSYLSALNPYRADDYDNWLAVGMALHSVSDSLLTDWDNWSRQSSKYKAGECEKKWKSFKISGKVSIASLAHMAKQDGWTSPFSKSTGRGYSSGIGGSNRRNVGGGSGGSGGDEGDGQKPLSVISLRSRILEILNRNQERSQRDEAFINLALTTQAPIREIKELANSIEAEVDLEESRSDRKAEVEKLLGIGKYQLELQHYLDPSVAQPLERVAKWMGTSSSALLTTLYAVIGSLLKVGTKLELIKATDFYALPVIYTGLVNESGSGKSPAQKTILKPLFALQAEAEAEYKEKVRQYQRELSEWKKSQDSDEPAPSQPIPREYYTTDATSEAIALIQSQQPDCGFLGWFDELPALFKSQGQYKNGRGADGEKILSGRDGTGFKVNRASGKRLVVEQSAYSITGGLQPSVLRQMMGDFTDANGQWARFLWAVMPVQPAPYPDDAIPFDVSGLLKGIYRRISKLTAQIYKLSPEAQQLYRNWYNELDQLKMSESRQGLRAVYSKMKGDTGVLALLLHCFNGCVKEGSTPELEVDAQTMAAAIKLAKYHIGQVKLIHSEGDAANGELAAIHTKIIQLSERKGWLKAADVRDIDRQTKKKFSADDIRRHFLELEASGFGQTKGERTRLMWSIYKDGPPGGGGTTHSGQTQDTFVELGTNSGQTQDSEEKAESFINTSLQSSGEPTQDTQDIFEAAPPILVNSENEIEIKPDGPSVDVPSCPELVSESQNVETADVPAQDTTQDTCPETAPSCPELNSSVSNASATLPEEVPGVTFQPGDKVAVAANPERIGEVLQVDEDWGEYQVAFSDAIEWLDATDLVRVKQVINQATEVFKVGAYVHWTECPAHCENFAPFEITAIEGQYAKLDLFAHLVPLSELCLAT
jgi:hypothetical protein